MPARLLHAPGAGLKPGVTGDSSAPGDVNGLVAGPAGAWGGGAGVQLCDGPNKYAGSPPPGLSLLKAPLPKQALTGGVASGPNADPPCLRRPGGPFRCPKCQHWGTEKGQPDSFLGTRAMALWPWLGGQEQGAWRCLASAVPRNGHGSGGDTIVLHTQSPRGAPSWSAAARAAPEGLDSPEGGPCSGTQPPLGH